MRVDPRQWSDRARIVALALLVRVAAAVALSLWLALTETTAIQPDETDYLIEAADVAAGRSFTSHAYSNWIGILWRYTFESAWVPRTLNVIFGTGVVLVSYELALRLGGRRTARATGVALALWPSLVLWSVLILKDSPTGLAVVGVVLAFLVGTRTALPGGWLRVTSVAIPGLALAALRPWAYASTVIAVAIGSAAVCLVRPRLNAPIALVILIGVGGLTVAGPAGVDLIAERGTVEEVGRLTSKARGETGVARPPPQSVGDVGKQVPAGLAHSALGPLPWDANDRASRLLLFIEIPLWIVALGAAAVGIARRRLLLWPDWILPAAAVAGMALVLSIFEGNAGTAFRQRGMMVPFVVMFAATAFYMPEVSTASSAESSRAR